MGTRRVSIRTRQITAGTHRVSLKPRGLTASRRSGLGTKYSKRL